MRRSFEVRIVEQDSEPPPDTPSSAARPLNPSALEVDAMRGMYRPTSSPGSDVRDFFEMLRAGKPELAVLMKALAAHELKFAFDKARADLQQDPAGALNTLRTRKLDEPDWEGYRQALIDDCLTAMSPKQLVTFFFTQHQAGGPVQAIRLLTWQDEPCPNTTLE